MQEKIVHVSKIALAVVLLSFHIKSFGIAAYIPQTLRECISAIYEKSESQLHKQGLEELHAAVKENRMLVSDAVVRRGIKEALEVIQASSNRSDQEEMVEYLEQYLKNLQDKAILLSMEGNATQMRSWSVGLIERCMRDQQDACDLLRLSNELSDNLIFCGSEINEFSLDSRVMNDVKRGDMSFGPNNMTSSQSLTPNMILGSTGINSAVIDGWALAPDGPQFPVSMQFIIPDDFEKHKPVSLELGFIIPNNGLPNAYANFLVQAKYAHPKHSFNINDVHWTHTNSSGNVKIIEASNPDNVKYMFINIPLTRNHIKREYFALISVSRTMPTDGKTDYAGDLALVSAVFKYTSNE
jgi:hypothetical protein